MRFLLFLSVIFYVSFGQFPTTPSSGGLGQSSMSPGGVDSFRRTGSPQSDSLFPTTGSSIEAFDLNGWNLPHWLQIKFADRRSTPQPAAEIKRTPPPELSEKLTTPSVDGGRTPLFANRRTPPPNALNRTPQPEENRRTPLGDNPFGRMTTPSAGGRTPLFENRRTPQSDERRTPVLEFVTPTPDGTSREEARKTPGYGVENKRTPPPAEEGRTSMFAFENRRTPGYDNRRTPLPPSNPPPQPFTPERFARHGSTAAPSQQAITTV